MSRKIFLVALGITFGYLSSTFYGQQEGPAPQQEQSLLSPVGESQPAASERDLKTDPLLNEITDMFLKDGTTNRKLEYPKGGLPLKAGEKSPSVYHAAELLLKAARILESDDAKPASEAQRVSQLRAIAAEMLK